MNCPAHDACAFDRSFTLFRMSATLLLNSLVKNSGAYGSAWHRSPLRRPASSHARSIASSSDTIPAKCLRERSKAASG